MQLRADEAAVVEKAVRLAIESVMNVLCAVNSARTHELQRLVSDRERQIQRLEQRVREAETELRLLLRPRTPNSVPGSAPESVTEPRSRAEPEPRDVSVSLLSDPPSDLPDPPDQSGSLRDQSGSLRDQSGSLRDQSGSLRDQSQSQESHCELICPREDLTRDSSRVKQERLCPSPGRVKAEPVSPDRGPLLQDTMADGVFHQRSASEDVSHRLQGVLAEQWQSVSSQVEEVAVPHTLSVSGPHSTGPQPVSWRTKPSVSRRDQSDEAMRRRRASWRAASRRYYARKMARLQIQSDGPRYQPSGSGPTPSGPGPAPSGSGPTPWRYSVCDLASLQHQAPPSTDLTFMTESDLLGSSFSLNEHL